MKIGVIGAGSFGTAVANLLAENNDVMWFVRNQDHIPVIENQHIHKGQKIHSNVTPQHDLQQLASNCELIFPVVPSDSFRKMMRTISPFLKPSHILIHGTKGFDIDLPNGQSINEIEHLKKESIKVMTEVIMEESSVVRVGCISGPNLAKEIADHQPAATVIASRFKEVIDLGLKVLRSDRFQVFGSPDIVGVQLAGILKNIMAIASGMLSGLGYETNSRSMLIAKGLSEMIYIGEKLGADKSAFLGLAGVGDLVATCSSPLSRNFTVGNKLAQGNSLDDVLKTMDEVSEGVRTIKVTKMLCDTYNVPAIITQTLYSVLYEGLSVDEGLQRLMAYKYDIDVDFL